MSLLSLFEIKKNDFSGTMSLLNAYYVVLVYCGNLGSYLRN